MNNIKTSAQYPGQVLSEKLAAQKKILFATIYLIHSVVIFLHCCNYSQPGKQYQSCKEITSKQKNSPPPSQPSPSVLARFRILAQGRDLREAPCWQSFKCDSCVVYNVYMRYLLSQNANTARSRKIRKIFFLSAD